MTALLTATTYTVDPWDPGYGVAAGAELEGREPNARIELDVERPAAQWQPVSAPRAAARPDTVHFLDGVRRIDARVWVHGAEPQPVPALAASLAAGLVRCTTGTPAGITDVRLDRSLYTAADGAPDLVGRHAAYRVRRTGPGLDALSAAVQRQLESLERGLADEWVRTDGADGTGGLLVVDGPLHANLTHLPRALGYVKTHHEPYLHAPQAQVVAALAPGQRTPVFAMTTSWRRHSWYLRLPGSAGAPWSGIVRVECSADLPPDQVSALADTTCAVLPGLASTPHKDSRAPQNLVPIGGLERQLRHRLGDAALLYRSLRAATR